MTADEIKQLVGEIQQVLSRDILTFEDDLIDLAARHDDVVEQVAARLFSVEKLLDKGRREEAIALAEHEPNLNDIVTALDFPEAEAWNDYLIEFSIQPVRELPVSIASDLNDAYSVSAPLERLLQLYRTQSLSRAPLSERIDTLRQLTVEDSASADWQKDVIKFESHRVGQLKQELQSAYKQQELEQVAVLDQEISGKWAVKIPGGLKQAAREAHTDLRKRQAKAELEPLCLKLSDAYADFDKATATTLQTRFFALAEILDLSETDPLYDIAGPALDWLNEEASKAAANADFEHGRSQIEAALDHQTTIEELERLYSQTVRHGAVLPELLEHRLADRIEAIKASASRKRIAVMSSIVAGCLVAIIAVVLIIQQVTFRSAVAGHIVQLDQLTKSAEKSGDLKPVDDYYAKITTENIAFMQQPEILGRVKLLELLRTQEDGRLEQLNGLISSALQLGTETARWEDFPRAEAALKEAELITLNPAEKARVVNTGTQIQQVRSQMQTKLDSIFETDQEQLVEQVALLPKDSVALYADVENRIAELNIRPHVSSELKAALNALKTKVEQQKSTVQVNLEVSRSLQSVTGAAGRPIEFRKALMEFARKHPGTERAEDLLEIVRTDLPLWEGVDSWNSLRNMIKLTSLSTVAPAEAKRLVDQFAEFQKSSGPYPGTMGVERRVDGLKAIASREGGASGSSLEQLDRMLSPKSISEAYLVETTDGLRYFATTAPEITGSVIRFQFYTTTTGTQREAKALGVARILNVGTRTGDLWLAPQSVLARQLQTVFAEDAGIDLVNAITLAVERVLKQPGMDEILRLLLIERILGIGSEGDLFIRERMQTHLSKINKSDVSRLTNWAAPEDVRASSERQKAAAFLTSSSDAILEDLHAVKDDTATAMKQNPGPAMECVGWLHRNAEADWVVALKGEVFVTDRVTLQALGREGELKAAVFYKVADIEKTSIGSIAASPAVPWAKEGHPVYREVPTN